MTHAIRHRARRQSLSGSVCGPVREPERGRKIHGPWKQPDEIEQPEKHGRHSVVVARVAQIQKPKQLLVDEEEPQEAVVFAGNAFQRKAEIGRISEGGENVPGRGDEQNDQQAA